MDIETTEAWAAFIDMRKAKGKRAPFTSYAKTRILFELRRLAADGQDIEEVLWTSVTNGWSGVFAIKRKSGWNPGTVPSKEIEATQTYLAEHKATQQTPEDRAATAERLRLARARITGAA